MTDKKKLPKDNAEVAEEQKRKKSQKRLHKQTKEQSVFEEMLDDVLEDDELYHLLKKLKD